MGKIVGLIIKKRNNKSAGDNKDENKKQEANQE